MDVEAVVAAHREEWARLDELGRKRRLTGTEAEEMLDLYQVDGVIAEPAGALASAALTGGSVLVEPGPLTPEAARRVGQNAARIVTRIPLSL